MKRRRWPGSYWLAFFFCASVHESESKTVTASSCWLITPSAFNVSRTLSVTASISAHVGETSNAELALFCGGQIGMGGLLIKLAVIRQRLR